MMTINEPTEASDLREAVEVMIHQLIESLASADQPQQRELLRAKLARFERLSERLDRDKTQPAEVIHFA
ncbi:MAG: hypothetical protein JNK82_36705 [Myxococcaceae bacterium]|nr:hypothetical protein [Myxococcaceae bacterium]